MTAIARRSCSMMPAAAHTELKRAGRVMVERSFTKTISELEHGSRTNRNVRSRFPGVRAEGIPTLLVARTFFRERSVAMMSLTGRFPAATLKILGAVVEDSARLCWDEAEEHQYEAQVRVHSWLRPLVLSRFHRRDSQS